MSPSAAGTKPITSSTFYILMALADQDRHGLGIAEEVEARTQGEIVLGPGTLYNALRKLLTTGLIEESSERPDPEHDDPRRRYYRITDEGLQTVAAEAHRIERVLEAAREKNLLPTTRES